MMSHMLVSAELTEVKIPCRIFYLFSALYRKVPGWGRSGEDGPVLQVKTDHLLKGLYCKMLLSLIARSTIQVPVRSIRFDKTAPPAFIV